MLQIFPSNEITKNISTESKMDGILEKKIIPSAENLLSTVVKCQIENSHLLEIIENMRSSEAAHHGGLSSQYHGGGDAADLSYNKRTCIPHFQTKMTQKEYISLLIKNATEENTRLRESNVKLKLESKSHDLQIRDLNRKILLQEKIAQKNNSQREIINDLKKTIESKVGEIRLLKQNLVNVRELLTKEQKKNRNLQDERRYSASQMKINRGVQSKLDSLLSLTNRLLKDQEQAKSVISLNSCYIGKVQDMVNKLMSLNNNSVKPKIVNVKTNKAPKDVQKLVDGNGQVKIDASNSNDDKHNFKNGYSTITKIINKSDISNRNGDQNLGKLKVGRRRYKSV